MLQEVVIELNVNLEFVPKFCYLGDTLGAGGGCGGVSKYVSKYYFISIKALIKHK